MGQGTKALVIVAATAMLPIAAHATQLLGDIKVELTAFPLTGAFDLLIGSAAPGQGGCTTMDMPIWQLGMPLTAADVGSVFTAKKNNANQFARLDFDQLTHQFTNGDGWGDGLGEEVDFRIIKASGGEGGVCAKESKLWSHAPSHPNIDGNRYVTPFNDLDFQGYEIERFTLALDSIQGQTGFITVGFWGKLKPVSEPGTLALLGLGLLGVGVTRRRKAS